MTTTQEYRFELIMPDAMREGMGRAARASGNNASAYVRALIANDLERRFGPGWVELATEKEVTDDSK